MNDARNQRDGFPKRVRLLRGTEFRQVFDRKQSVADNVLIVYGRRQGLPHARLGLVVSRKAGNAIVRNRWKRCVREVFRKHLGALPAGIDIVVLPRRGAKPDYRAVNNSLPSLVRRLVKRLGRAELS